MNTSIVLFNTSSYMPIYTSTTSILNLSKKNNNTFSIANKKNKSYLCLVFFGIVYAYNYYFIV